MSIIANKAIHHILPLEGTSGYGAEGLERRAMTSLSTLGPDISNMKHGNSPRSPGPDYNIIETTGRICSKEETGPVAPQCVWTTAVVLDVKIVLSYSVVMCTGDWSIKWGVIWLLCHCFDAQVLWWWILLSQHCYEASIHSK